MRDFLLALDSMVYTGLEVLRKRSFSLPRRFRKLLSRETKLRSVVSAGINTLVTINRFPEMVKLPGLIYVLSVKEIFKQILIFFFSTVLNVFHSRNYDFNILIKYEICSISGTDLSVICHPICNTNGNLFGECYFLCWLECI